MTQHFNSDCLTRFRLLAGKLPARGGKRTAVVCRKCGAWSGLVANSAGIMVGNFAPQIERDGMVVAVGTMLVNCALIDESRVSLKCMSCGFVTRWRR